MILFCSTARQSLCVLFSISDSSVYHSQYQAALLRANAVVCIYTEYGQ